MARSARPVGWLLAALSIVLVACSSSPDVTDGAGATATPESQIASAPRAPEGADTLAEVRRRGFLRVGVNDQLPGFGYIRSDGSFGGFDVDFGHALAAAIFGDRDAVQFVALSASSRFEALDAREIDVLIRNTTWSLSRDTSLGLSFAVPTFYDGQGLMVRARDDIHGLDDLQGAVVCSLSGTTTQLNQEDTFGGTTVRYQPLNFDRAETLQEAFVAGRCDAWTADRSQLASRRAAYPARAGGPESLVILPDTLSKEPLAPAMRSGEEQWSDLVNWVVLGMIAAEELGVSSHNVREMAAAPTSAEVARLLGAATEGLPFDAGLGLTPDFMQDVIEQVGNYGEVYDRNITPLGIPREGSPNALWTQGGLMYAPPYR
ncbi:MAG: amino acid ABC transporter substrate-binding protein [Dehalococcoidia bacterium]|nr:amino acid ABC transporter substrate-binding protein [Dehalococcoidia bacterium]